MIEALLPDDVVVVATDGDLTDVDLFPEEVESLGDAVDKRRREFTTGRACARRALEQIGFGPAAIATGDRGQPLWPDGVAGSITHCDGYRACAVTRTGRIASVGIDAETHAVLPDGVFESVASLLERTRLHEGAGRGIHLDRVLFSAKEAVYKAWFPLTGRWLGFEDVDMTVGRDDGTFKARLLVPGPVVDGAPLTGFRGRWQVRNEIVLTAVTVPPAP